MHPDILLSGMGFRTSLTNRLRCCIFSLHEENEHAGIRRQASMNPKPAACQRQERDTDFGVCRDIGQVHGNRSHEPQAAKKNQFIAANTLVHTKSADIIPIKPARKGNEA